MEALRFSLSFRQPKCPLSRSRLDRGKADVVTPLLSSPPMLLMLLPLPLLLLLLPLLLLPPSPLGLLSTTALASSIESRGSLLTLGTGTTHSLLLESIFGTGDFGRGGWFGVGDRLTAGDLRVGDLAIGELAMGNLGDLGAEDFG